MGVAGMALAVVGYALFYTGASNLFTGGKGWGFLQSLLNKGEINASGTATTAPTAGGPAGKKLSPGEKARKEAPLNKLWKDANTIGKALHGLGVQLDNLGSSLGL